MFSRRDVLFWRQGASGPAASPKERNPSERGNRPKCDVLLASASPILLAYFALGAFPQNNTRRRGVSLFFVFIVYLFLHTCS